MAFQSGAASRPPFMGARPAAGARPPVARPGAPLATGGASSAMQQQVALKRVLPQGAHMAAPAAKLPKAAGTLPSEEAAIVVFSTADRDEIGIRTLLGDYKEEGDNHGRKFYKKMGKIPGHEHVDVFLYFWDERDGPAFSGWWFGNQVGGAQVWSRNKQCLPGPPKSGWTIPWDGPVKKELVVMPAKEKALLDQNEAKTRKVQRMKEEVDQSTEADVSQWETRVQTATEKAATAEVDATQAIEDASAAMEGGDEDEIAQAAQQLTAQAQVLTETQRFIAVEGLAAQKAPPKLRAEVMALGQRIRKLQATIKEEQAKLRNAKAKQAVDEETRLAEEARLNELEGQQSKQLEEMIPPAMEKVDLAEDEVEKVAIAAAPLKIDSADDLRPVMLQAIKDTEQRVRAAQAAIGEARRFISGKLSQVQRFSPATKKSALEEFTSLQNKLNEAQERLNPYKTVRQDYESKMQTKKLFDELSSKLAGAEIEVEKAAMMTAPLSGDTTEGIKETEAALSAAQSALSQTSRLIESKLKSMERTKNASLDDIKTLQERAKLSQDKLDEIRKTVKETQVRIAADTLLREVSEKVSNAEDELQRMAEAELPFLRGEQRGEALDSLIAEADKITSKVHTAIAEAQTFVAKKLVEVARFTEGPAKAVREEIDMLQKRLEEGRERLQQFKASTADKKRTHLIQEIEVKVGAAETEVAKMAEATAALSTISTAGDVVTDSLKETVEQANAGERASQAAIVVARKVLLQNTAELKKLAISSAGSGTELGKLQTRLNNMQQEIVKMRSATKDAEERVRVKQMLGEVTHRLQMAETDVEKVASVAALRAEDQPSPEQVERMEKATASAQMKLSATAKVVDLKLKSAGGFLKEELSGMRTRLTAAEKKLSDVIRAAREQKERLQASELLALSAEKVDLAEAAIAQTASAELPFLKGIEALPSQDAQTAIGESEAAAAAAQKAITEARAFVVQKLGEARGFSEGPSAACVKDLTALQKKIDAGAARLGELKKDTAERKRKTQMQASGEKIAGVEAAVQKLSTAMEKFADERLADISEDEARTVCEDIGNCEQDAQDAVSGARKFLALRVQEAKGYGEAQRAPMTAELAKLQSRLTQCQVELAKLSKTCTEREQRYVAQKLVADSMTALEKLQGEVEAAVKVAKPVLEEDAAALLKSAYAQAVGDALRAHIAASGKDISSLFKSMSKGANAKKEDFLKFVSGIPEVAHEEAGLAEEQLAQAFDFLASPGGALTQAKLEPILREHLVCTASVTCSDAAEAGNEVGTIEAGEGVVVLERKDKRAKCTLARNGTTVWVTLDGPDGEAVFKSPQPSADRLESVDAYVQAVHARCSDAAEQAERKAVEVASVKQGPLADVKTKLLQVRSKVSQEQSKIDQVKKNVSAAKSTLVTTRKQEQTAVAEVRFKDFSTKAIKECTSLVGTAEAKANEVISKSKSGNAETLKKELSAAQLQSLTMDAEKALQELADARKAVVKAGDSFEAYKGPARSVMLEARVELTKLTSRATALEKKCRAATDAVRAAYSQVVKVATQQARNALRAAARKVKKGTDEMFDQIAAGKDELPLAVFTKFVKSLPEHGLTDEQVKLVFTEMAPYGGLKKNGFAKAMQEYCTCAKPTPITDKCDIGASSTVRKLEPGEVFEVLEGPEEDKESKVQRVRGRALRDGATGWVSLSGSQGAPFLKPASKPYMCVVGDASLRKEVEDTGAALRALHKDEVLELLEGPREENAQAELHLQGKASKDGAAGWFTLRNARGQPCASLSEDTYVCKSVIAMTDNFDIKKCKVVRKVEVGEALHVIGGKKEQEDSKIEITRLQFRALRDGKEGWVTLKGNQGTIFVQASKKHYTLNKEAALRDSSARDAAAVRMLEVGEAFEASGAPVEEQPEPKLSLRARALEDGKIGWVSLSGAGLPPLRPWKPSYTCRTAVNFTQKLSAKTEAVGKAEPGEVFEVVDGPSFDKDTGVRRVQCAKPSKGIVGWATLRSAEGVTFLEAA